MAPPLSHPTDGEDVFRVANVWCGSSRSARLFVEFVVAETVALVRSRQFAVPLRAVTQELLVHGELTGDQVHELVEANNCYRTLKEQHRNGKKTLYERPPRPQSKGLT